ncbi:MAG: WYL domain-containing protein [Eubacterium sp.]|nr:WYL domain-containing protein [Candidatus Colimonas fimequi]
MKANNSNSLAALYILQILNKYSNETHPLTHREIGELLADKYNFSLERKAIGRNLSRLAEEDFGVVILPHKGAYTNRNRFLSDEETRIILDMVNDSPYLTGKQLSRLTHKLVDSASDRLVVSKGPAYKHNGRAPEKAASPVSTVDVVGIFNDACSQCRQVRIRYTDGLSLHGTCGTPCDLVFDNGKYFLKLYDEFTHEMRWIRVENIRHIELLKTPATHRINMKSEDVALSRFVAPGETPTMITLSVSSEDISKVRDTFEGCVFSEIERGDETTLLVKASPSRVADYAKKHLGLFSVQQPPALRNEIKNYVEEAYMKYAS